MLLIRVTLQAGAQPPAKAIAPREDTARDEKRPHSYSVTSSLYPELPKGPILSPASTHSSISYKPTALTVLSLREVPDGNQGTIRAYVHFSMSDLSMEEDKLESFSEDHEIFTEGLTQLVRSHLGRFTGLTIPLLHP